MSRSILWFRQDLRLHDNEALVEACRNADELIPVYIFDQQPHRISEARAGFLIESVADLRHRLRKAGSDLVVRTGRPDEILYRLALKTRSPWVYCNRERTRDEVVMQDSLEKKLWTIGCELRYARGKMLYYTLDLPFPVTHCPDVFVMFRKEVEHIIPVRQPLDIPDLFPIWSGDIEPGPIPSIRDILQRDVHQGPPLFRGGETAGLKALEETLHMAWPVGLDQQGKALSPWISMGCLSPKKVYHDSFAMTAGGEEVRQNLMYRDYLRLMGKKYGDRIFYASGVRGKSIQAVKNQEALVRWQSGQTGVAIIDAAMHQLNRTGWIPDVLRRLTAHYFLKGLRLDWRLGAAYFETRQIDYDPCSNWVAWQNLAGIGPDAKEERILHYDAVAKKLDPEGLYVNTWG